MKWNPYPLRVGSEVYLTVFRNPTEDGTSNFNYEYEDSRTFELQDVLSSALEVDGSIPPAPAGFSVTSFCIGTGDNCRYYYGVRS